MGWRMGPFSFFGTLLGCFGVSSFLMGPLFDSFQRATTRNAAFFWWVPTRPFKRSPKWTPFRRARNPNGGLGVPGSWRQLPGLKKEKPPEDGSFFRSRGSCLGPGEQQDVQKRSNPPNVWFPPGSESHKQMKTSGEAVSTRSRSGKKPSERLHGFWVYP